MGSVHVYGVARLPRAEYWLFDPRPVMQGFRSDLSRDAKVDIRKNSAVPNSPTLNQIPATRLKPR